MIILPNDLSTQEIRVLQEFRRLNAETMTPEQIKAIKHPAGGGEAPAASLVGKGYLSADAAGFTLTEKAKAFLAYDPKPEFDEVGSAGRSVDENVEADGV
ncbi:MAG TPA: hypothetical protein VEK79_09230 [Thermoanaerobaculia bacterium]|nr:hypothetical protein [Thermoanaerobaculia bacterium]